ncbi:3'(2'),5'-bisphosphate nucleotidase [Andreprevotia lacus DSM 23236]|jgi:3'(2'), 5'-bisphosphate nucleotidase|uniref:3'(2'),5'-bisphosphate nucleotidase CysQ n=1 Tax=Andreprevotia lacus DSM 23236 TaxID=1121001 RepID=A0A1W1XHE8_9NEIS|nr:3'(2'),5'-bisphosphate nucleotidase CysQ [Andreprevotia lacus]SMC23436.1 3'(2'),5'-bisphosphate nucleotidase [Andreprevotia lacus DSM 23236]
MQSSHDHARIEAELVRIARLAGDAIMAVYAREDLGVQTKGDGSPLTQADLAANRVILRELQLAFPWPVLSEETPIEYPQRQHWTTFWLVDPLDGTKDFLDRNGEFTVNIALIEQGRATHGVIYAPAIDELYYGAVGVGAWCTVRGNSTALPQPWGGRALAQSRHHDVPQAGDFAALNGNPPAVAIGSALKFGRLVAGQVDIYPRFTGSSEWDTAAGDALLQACGCQLRALPGLVPMRYNTESLRNPHFIAAAPHVQLDQLSYPT